MAKLPRDFIEALPLLIGIVTIGVLIAYIAEAYNLWWLGFVIFVIVFVWAMIFPD